MHYVLENGIMNGMGNAIFAPNTTTSFAMIVTMFWRMEGKPEYHGIISFEDVDAEAWYTPAVHWASAEGSVNGYSDTAFAPMTP